MQRVRVSRRLGVAGVLLLACGGEAAFGADFPYTITRLQPLSTLDGSPPGAQVIAVDDRGMAVGNSKRTRTPDSATAPDRTDAVFWAPHSSSPTPLQNLVNLPRMGGYASGIDAAGNIYGNLLFDDPASFFGYRPVRWPAGSTQPQPLPRGNLNSPHIITAGPEGTAVGMDGYNEFGRAIVWRPGDAAPLDIARGIALGVNRAGIVVGQETVVGDTGYLGLAFRWQPGATAPTRLNGGTAAEGINDAGAIVGYKSTATPTTFTSQALLWAPGSTTPTILGYLPGVQTLNVASARDVNDAGVVIGSSGGEPVLWQPGTLAVKALSTLFDGAGRWTLSNALDISNNGHIVGSATYDPDGAGPAQPESAIYRLDPNWSADANGDFVVNFVDFQILERNFGRSLAAVDPVSAKALGDFNSDGVVDFADYGILRREFGGIPGVSGGAAADVPALSVPEPGLAFFGGAAVLLLRRRVRR